MWNWQEWPGPKGHQQLRTWMFASSRLAVKLLKLPRNPSFGHSGIAESHLWSCFSLLLCLHILCPLLLVRSIRSKLSWVGDLSPPSWFCPKVSLSSMKPEQHGWAGHECGYWRSGSVKFWEGKEVPKKTGRGWEAIPSSDNDKKTAMGLI